MASLNTFTKQPADRLDYDFDYKAFLLGNDTIIDAVFTAEPVGLGTDTPVVEPKYAKIWVYGGVAGTTYKITCTVTTEHGRVKQDEIKIRVKEY